MNHTRTLLIIEDDPSIRRLAKRMLSGLEMEMLEGETGADALAVLEAKTTEIDAVIVDLRLPDIQGDELIAWMRNTVPELPVILFTGNHLSEGVKTLLEERNTYLLTKPFTKASLMDVVEKAFVHACPA